MLQYISGQAIYQACEGRSIYSFVIWKQMEVCESNSSNTTRVWTYV